ncbi:hypothetical protein Gpo141_00002534 [Globisporangium polare]
MGQDRKRKQPSSSSASSAIDAQQDQRAPRHAKFYAIAAITNPPAAHHDATLAALERMQSPVSSAPPEASTAAAEHRADTDMSLLPRSVMELVFSFALKDLSLKLGPAKCKGWKRVSREKINIDKLARWRGVCSYWRELIDEIVAQFKQRRLKVNFSYKNSDQVHLCIQEIMKHGGDEAQLVDLRVALYGYYDVRQGLEAASRIPWHDLLRHCPNLQRLDLSEMTFLTRAHMGSIVEAAAQHCLKLQALILPLPLAWDKYARFYSRVQGNDQGQDQGNSEPRFALDDEVFQDKLEKALARWFTRGRHLGLRQLTVAHSLWTSDAFISAVTKYCPRIEVLDGWKLTYLCDGWAPITCDDEWKVSEATWAAFCRTCVHLREFNWAVVPFTDAFFRPFGATPKVLLTDLYLDFSDSFGADEGAEDAAVSNALAAAGYGTPRISFFAQPQPQVHPQPNPAPPPPPTEYVDVAKPYSSEGLCALVRGLPFLTKLKVYMHPSVRIDVNVFDDQFLTELSRSTPYLEQLSIVEAGQYEGSEAIETISEAGLSTLAKMTTLADVAFTALREVTADGVLAFVRHRTHCVRQRNIKVGVMKGIAMCIIDILKTLAKDEDSGAFEGKPFALVIENQGLYRGLPADPKSVKRVEDKMHSLKALLEKRHPGIKCQLTLSRESNSRVGGKGELSYRIAKFALFSTTWSFPDAFGGTFYRGDIAYDPKDSKPFEMILRVG